MKTIQECYLIALQKSEQNLTNGGIKMDKARFIQIFNAEQIRLIRYILDKKNDEAIRDIQQLLIYSLPLTPAESIVTPESKLFNLPNDFFAFSNVRGIFRQGNCTDFNFSLWEAKNENIHELLVDENNKPSFEFRETFYTIGQNSINIYLDDFVVDKLTLTYYRYPKNVDISGYIKADGSSSSNIDPELDDKLVDVILNMVQKVFALNENEYYMYNLSTNNVNSPK